MRLVYVAGPFRAGDSWAIEQNIRRACDLLDYSAEILGSVAKVRVMMENLLRKRVRER